MRETMIPLRRAVARSSTRRFASLAPALRASNSPRCIERIPAPWRPSPRAAHVRLASFLHRAPSTTSDEPTIYALSTATGRAAIAVIRISGPACAEIYHAFCPDKPLPKPRHAALRTLYDPTQPVSAETVLDSALVLFFAAPSTVTGEDVLELHVHGGPATVKAVLAAIPACAQQSPGRIRYAEPGEFTRRAFLNDRLDLTQVEALGDTLTATTEQQRRLSVRGTAGGSGLSQRYEQWRQQLLAARGELEALIDFAEDQHFDEAPAQLASSVAAQARVLKAHMDAHAANAVRGELLRNGISIALLGEPNAGKSSLLNRIVGREAAIVSQEAGTTRDVVETGVDLGGWYCRLGDTAGLRKNDSGPADAAAVAAAGAASSSSSASSAGVGGPGGGGIVGAIEQEGIRRAKERALDADVVICVFSIEPSEKHAADGQQQQPPPGLSLSAEVIETARECMRRGGHVMAIINKSDLLEKHPDRRHRAPEPLPRRSGHDDYEIGGYVHAVPTGSHQLRHLCAAAVQAELSLPSERVHFVSCRDAADAASSKTPDPGNIQAFLAGLIAVFREMTAPLVPELEDAGAAGEHAATAAANAAAAPDMSVWQESLGATERQRVLLDECSAHLHDFLREVEEGHEERDGGELDIVLAAESLRAAAACLAKITGRGEAGDVEEVLGVVFEKFCVGK